MYIYIGCYLFVFNYKCILFTCIITFYYLCTNISMYTNNTILKIKKICISIYRFYRIIFYLLKNILCVGLIKEGWGYIYRGFIKDKL